MDKQLVLKNMRPMAAISYLCKFYDVKESCFDSLADTDIIKWAADLSQSNLNKLRHTLTREQYNVLINVVN